MDIILVIPAFRPPNTLPSFIREAINRGFHDIIVVDDGSENQYQTIFSRCQHPTVTILQHKKNKGKGTALKTAFQYCIDHKPSDAVIITADCDGQHRIDDIEKLIYTIKADNNGIYLGARNFNKNVPFKSRLGNMISAKLFYLFYHLELKDTQTGLRAFPAKMLPQMIRIPGSRYEYETNVLIYAAHQRIPIKTMAISGIYFNKNKDSHYRPFWDSLRITSSIAAHVYKKM